MVCRSLRDDAVYLYSDLRVPATPRRAHIRRENLELGDREGNAIAASRERVFLLTFAASPLALQRVDQAQGWIMNCRETVFPFEDFASGAHRASSLVLRSKLLDSDRNCFVS